MTTWIISLEWCQSVCQSWIYKISIMNKKIVVAAGFLAILCVSIGVWFWWRQTSATPHTSTTTETTITQDPGGWSVFWHWLLIHSLVKIIINRQISLHSFSVVNICSIINNIILGGTSTPTPTTSASSSTLPNPGGSSRELILEIDQTWSQEPSGYTRSNREERKKENKENHLGLF